MDNFNFTKLEESKFSYLLKKNKFLIGSILLMTLAAISFFIIKSQQKIAKEEKITEMYVKFLKNENQEDLSTMIKISDNSPQKALLLYTQFELQRREGKKNMKDLIDFTNNCQYVCSFRTANPLYFSFYIELIYFIVLCHYGEEKNINSMEKLFEDKKMCASFFLPYIQLIRGTYNHKSGREILRRTSKGRESSDRSIFPDVSTFVFAGS